MSIIASVTEKMTSHELTSKLKRFIPDLNQAENYLKGDPEAVISKFLPVNKTGTLTEPSELAIENKKRQIKPILEAGLRALEKIRQNKENVNFDLQEKLALCSIIVNIGRPAFLIQDGHFPQKGRDGQDGGLPPNWWILDDYREGIEKTCKSVGRIEHSDSESSDVPGGTGFLIAKDIVITNKHVVDYFAYNAGNMKWKIRKPTNPRIDYSEEYGSNENCEFAVKKIIGIHDTLDIALLKIKTKSQILLFLLILIRHTRIILQ